MKLSPRHITLISEHPFMVYNGADFMQLEFCTKPYQVIERVLTNVAAKNGITWKDLLQTGTSDEELFIELCVAVILIDRYLKLLFNIEKADKLILTGTDFAEAIQDYNNSFSIY